MNTSQDFTEISKALINVQKQLQPAIKDANNSFTKSTYATLNSVMSACHQLLLDNGVLLTQMPVPAPVELGSGHIALETRLIHADSGQWLSSTTIIPLPKNDPQGMGSAITYARRYSLCAMLGIITEDDDGNAASIPVQQNAHSQQYSNHDFARNEQQHKPVNFPKIDGVNFEEEYDDDGRTVLVATGKTLQKKDILKANGFRWDVERKVWYKFLDAA